METKEKTKKMSGMNNGFVHLLLNIAMLVAFILIVVKVATLDCMTTVNTEGIEVASNMIWIPIVLASVFIIIWIIHLRGLTIVQPNMARAFTFFGKYKGTLRENGFFWVNPFYGNVKLSLRARNMDVDPIKVNDKNGNPIMIGLVLVWKITDTYKASFEIETNTMSANNNGQAPSLKGYDNFVKVQSDAALRKVAGLYAYDNMDNHMEEVTLRSGGEEINERLEKELMQHLEIAGIEVIEARINYLAYAQEIASVMLRRQQADAIISAREKIVEGAVSMVDLALKKLSEDQIVELDEERKAAMVSNLLVVLCADESASPVINTGSLYQ